MSPQGEASISDDFIKKLELQLASLKGFLTGHVESFLIQILLFATSMNSNYTDLVKSKLNHLTPFK